MRFYWKLILRIPGSLWGSASFLEKTISVSAFCLSVFGVTAWWPFSPLWALAPVALLFIYGLMKANYDKFRELERERDALQIRIAELENQTTSRQPSELKGFCFHLSGKLRRFVEARERNDPAMRIWRQRMDAETEKEKSRLWQEEFKAWKQHEAETMTRYDEIYQERTMALYGDLGRRGWCGPEDRPYFECPENPTEIREAAERLEAIGHRLSED